MKRILAFAAGLAAAVFTLSAQTNGYWDERFWMADSARITGLAAGPGNRLLIFGQDLKMGSSRADPRIAFWDGKNWSPAATNTTGIPSALAFSGNHVWMAGMPTTNKVTRVDLKRNADILLPVNGRISAIAADENTVIIGGTFAAGVNNSSTNMARWNGSDWTPLGSGVPYPVIKLLATNGMVFAGVSQDTNRNAAVWSWDGTSWSELGPIQRGGKVTVRDIAWHSGKLIVATSYDTPGETNDDGAVMSWTGSAWTNYTTPSLHGQAYALAVFRDELYTGGLLRVGNSETPTIGVGRFSDGRWIPMELEPGDPLGAGAALAVADNQLFALARFPASGEGILLDRMRNGLWQYDGGEWRQHCNGLTPIPGFNNMASTPEGVLLAVPSSVRWGSDGLHWNGRYFRDILATNPAGDFTIQARGKVVSTSSGVYRGAVRTPVSPDGAYLLAKLVGDNFIPEGDAIPINLTMPNALVAASGKNDIVVSGPDTSANNTPVVALWSNGRWQRLGGTFAGGQIMALAPYEGGILAGGSFTSIGGQPMTNLAHWNGTRWQPVLPAPNGAVRNFAPYDGGVFVAGAFSSIGGISSRALAYLKSGTWLPAPEGQPLTGAFLVAVSDGGSIALSDRAQIWLYRKGSWLRIANGGSFLSLLWRGQDLMVGGSFIEIGLLQSDMFAIWHEPEPALSISPIDGNNVRITRTGARNSVQILGRGNGLDQIQPWRTNSPLDLRDTFTDTVLPGASQNFYSDIAP